MSEETIRSAEEAFFDQMESLLRSADGICAEERRGRQRRAYRCVQLLAPYDGESLPCQAEFRPVQCHDLSPSGFSFFSDRRLETPELIVALGKVPFQFFRAKLLYQTPQVDGGDTVYKIGAQFVQRL